MATLQQALTNRLLEGEKLRFGTLQAGEQILPQAAGAEQARVGGLSGQLLQNQQQGLGLQSQQQQLAQRFLSGGLRAPLSAGARETLESGRREATINARSTASGQGGFFNAQRGAIDRAHAIGRSQLQGQADDRLFRQLSANLTPGLEGVPTPQLSAAQNTAAGSANVAGSASHLERRLLQIDQQNDRQLDDLLGILAEGAVDLLGSLF